MRVAVVGAGLAGLQVARRLQAAGREVRLFEKARGASGRLSTRRSDQGDFDHGAQYFTARSPAFRRQVEDWVDRGVAARWTPRVVRLRDGERVAEDHASERYVGLPGMSGLARDLRRDLEIELGVRIVSAGRQTGCWTLRSEDEIEYGPFSDLVLAVPAPQAAPLLTECPELLGLVEGVPMLPCHAVMARFAEPLGVDFDAAFVEHEALAWVARAASKPAREDLPCWTLHSQAAWSEAHLELEPGQVAHALLEALAVATGRPLPEVAFSATHRWLYARTGKPLATRSIFDSEKRLGLCGDWVQGDRVEDAYLGAERLVAEMALHGPSD